MRILVMVGRSLVSRNYLWIILYGDRMDQLVDCVWKLNRKMKVLNMISRASPGDCLDWLLVWQRSELSWHCLSPPVRVGCMSSEKAPPESPGPRVSPGLGMATSEVWVQAWAARWAWRVRCSWVTAWTAQQIFFWTVKCLLYMIYMIMIYSELESNL